MKTALESTKNKEDHIKERISDHEDRNLEGIQVKEAREQTSFLNEKMIWKLSGSIRKGNIIIMGIQGGKERESLFKETVAVTSQTWGRN